MGYTTDFQGSLKISRPLTQKQVKYINLLSETRRMSRDCNKLMKLYKGKHGNPFAKDKTNAVEVYGEQGQFFAMDDGQCGQSDDGTIRDYNSPGRNVQPGLWCQWVISEDGSELSWDGGEKFYNYVEWLQYLINNFFKPWGRKLNGEIEWFGEDRSDMGRIVVEKNKISIQNGEVEFKEKKQIPDMLVIIGAIVAVGATLALVI